MTILFYLVAGVVVAQPDVKDHIRYGEQLYVEIIQVPSPTASGNRIDVLLRISQDFLVFKRTDSLHHDSLFSARVDLTIDVQNESGQLVSSGISGTTVYTGDYEQTNSRDRFLLFRNSFQLPVGMYRFHVTVTDGNSSREKIETKHLLVKSLDSVPQHISSVIPVITTEVNAIDVSEILGFGHSILFAQPCSVIISGSANAQNWQFALWKYDDEENQSDTLFIAALPITFIQQRTTTAFTGSISRFDLANCDSCVGGFYLFRLPYDTLSAGQYSLRVVASFTGRSDTTVQPLRVFWKNMPLSLHDVDFALRAMRYILTKDEIDEMGSGTSAEKESKLRLFWQKRDPTPGTVVNEAMIEYFKRVDEAYYKFQTLGSPNGALTDRGKIYILFGAPDEVQRELRPGEDGQEIWRYSSIQKTFRFINRDGSGNMRLVKE